MNWNQPGTRTRQVALTCVLSVAVTLCSWAQSTGGIPGWTPGVYALVSGTWERTGERLTSPRHLQSFSWGDGPVRSNWGITVDLATEDPFVTHYGSLYRVKAVATDDDRSIVLDLADTSAVGPLAFVRLIFVANPDGTAKIDFEYAGGGYFGAYGYSRTSGPGDK